MVVMILMAFSPSWTALAYLGHPLVKSLYLNKHTIVSPRLLEGREDIDQFSSSAIHSTWIRRRSLSLFASNFDSSSLGSFPNHSNDEPEAEEGTGTTEGEEVVEDEEDLIMRKLWRNAQHGPINPIKEHDKMIQENRLEANDLANAEISISISDSINSTSDAPLPISTSKLYSSLIASYADIEFDPDVSSDELYLESQFKELLSRQGEDLLRLGPGISTLPLDPSSEEAKVEGILAQKELALQRVTEKIMCENSETWDTSKIEDAVRIKTEIDRLHVDDCGAVLLANLGFYEAFSARDADWMNEIWWHSPSVICIHPSHSPLIGSAAVLDSFKNMFLNRMKASDRRNAQSLYSDTDVFITPTNIRGFSVRGITASLVCDEEVHAKRTVGNDYRGGYIINKMITTNVFRKIGGKWKMVHRHASWHPETLAADAAKKSKPGLATIHGKQSKNEKNMRNISPGKKTLTIKKLNGGVSKRKVGLPTIPTSLEGVDVNDVLGISRNNQKQDTAKLSARSDESGDIIRRLFGIGNEPRKGKNSGDKKESVEDTLADLLSGEVGESGTIQTTGSGTPDDPFITKRFIRIGPEDLQRLTGNSDMNKRYETSSNIDEDEEENSDDDEEEDDAEEVEEEEEKSIVIDLRDKSEDERQQILSEVVDKVLKDTKGISPEKKRKSLKSSTVDILAPSQKKEKQSKTQKCIATIQRLSKKGLLSSKQKQVLLTDIIASCAKGESSLVEVAYGLLCDEDEYSKLNSTTFEGGDCAGINDFTEQCRIFASASLSEDYDG